MDIKKYIKKEYLTIPNIITLVRLILIPVFAITMFHNMIIGLILFIICATSDMLDGWIARKFNAISNLGKVLDPVADKLMNITVMICLSIIYIDEVLPFYVLAITIAAKELIMLLVGLFLISKKIVVPANNYGKAAMFTLSIGVIIIFLGKVWPFAYTLGYIISALGVAISLVALCVYAGRIWEQLGRKLPDGKEFREISVKKPPKKNG